MAFNPRVEKEIKGMAATPVSKDQEIDKAQISKPAYYIEFVSGGKFVKKEFHTNDIRHTVKLLVKHGKAITKLTRQSDRRVLINKST